MELHDSALACSSRLRRAAFQRADDELTAIAAGIGAEPDEADNGVLEDDCPPAKH
jgi:hypothetical protein